MKKILVIGSVSIDLITKVKIIPKENEVAISEGLLMNIGGKATNGAIGLARLLNEVFICGCIGDDTLKNLVIDTFNYEKINISSLETNSVHPTGTVLVNVDEKGNNTIIVNEDANLLLSKNTITKAITEDLDAVYITLELKPEIIEYALINTFKNSIPILLDAAPQVWQLDKTFYKYITFLTANEYEAYKMTGIKISDLDSAKLALNKLRDDGGRNIIITFGDKGVFALEENSNEILYREVVKVEVIDSTGAGDAFRAGFLTKYLETKDFNKSIEFENLCGSLAVTKLGSYKSMPNLSEVR